MQRSKHTYPSRPNFFSLIRSLSHIAHNLTIWFPPQQLLFFTTVIHHEIQMTIYLCRFYNNVCGLAALNLIWFLSPRLRDSTHRKLKGFKRNLRSAQVSKILAEIHTCKHWAVTQVASKPIKKIDSPSSSSPSPLMWESLFFLLNHPTSSSISIIITTHY